MNIIYDMVITCKELHWGWEGRRGGQGVMFLVFKVFRLYKNHFLVSILTAEFRNKNKLRIRQNSVNHHQSHKGDKNK